MKSVLVFFIIVLLCTVGTIVFMAFHCALFEPFSMSELCQVVWHSVPQHMTIAGYVMALPLLVTLIHVWRPLGWYRSFMAFYLSLVSVPLIIGWAVNLVLYGYWGIVLDGTALFYLLDNPADALAESPVWAVILLTVLVVVVSWTVFKVVRRFYGIDRQVICDASRRRSLGKVWQTIGMLLLCGLDFLAIRGGWTPATMNPGRAYFSTEMVLNHAAVDPVFNFLYSISKNKRFDKQYRFMSDEEAQAAITELQQFTSVAQICAQQTNTVDAVGDSAMCLLRTQRPNILLVLLESFSGGACQYLYPDADSLWMPNVNRAMNEGVAFTRFYANSFRTDRGVAAVLASYPGQPTNSVMKDQTKCNNLQYLSQSLGEEGYRLQFIHGGDVNFTNMQGFLRAGGITDIVGDTDFPIEERLDKWGVRDDQMFDYVADQVLKDVFDAEKPFFKVFLSLSSHEPFDVPFHHFQDPYINSVAYADSCLGALLQKLQNVPEAWDNLLIIGLPDHCFAKFPLNVQQHDPLRYHIPMFWTGGAVAAHCDVCALGQQTDLAATLLGQLGIKHGQFNFSKDMLDPSIPHFAFYAFSDGFGLITDSCQYVQDNKNNGVGLQPGTNDPDGTAERWGKAYLQKLYDDLQQR